MHRRVQKSGYDGKIAGLYDLEQTIGQGHYAVVKLARHVFTGAKVAVKVIDKTKLDEVSKAHLFQEVRCMKLVQHPNVVRLYEVIDTQTKLYLILELGDGGDMYDYIMKHEKGLLEEDARRYFRQIVQAINYCHQLHVVHRDLKPENVVFFEKLGIVKLTDFGFSNKFIPGTMLETSCGSLAYSAPEILLGDSYDAPAVDIWSLGVILYMLVCGEPPFREANDSETLTMIMDCRYTFPPELSKECRDLVSIMLVREPEQRATLKEIMKHPWVGQGEAAALPLMPLVSREDISEDDHTYIVQKMAEGKIASKDEILAAIEKDAYNHITATYYLLAERKMRKQREVQANSAAQAKRPEQDAKPNLAPLALSPRIQQKFFHDVSCSCNCDDPSECSCMQMDPSGKDPTPPGISSLVSPPGSHMTAQKRDQQQYVARKCSLIQEESIEEDEEDMDFEHEVHHARSEDCLSDDSDSRNSNKACYSGTSSAPPQGRRGGAMKPLQSVRSSPQLLNQIHEEGESEEDDILPKKLSSPRFLHARQSISSPSDPTRKKRFTAKHRGTSCSSSDASDTDDTDTRRRKEKLKHRFHRRDSSDHSSDTDGPGGPSVGASGGRAKALGGSRHRGSSNQSQQGSNAKSANNDNNKQKSSKERKQSGFTKQNLGNLTLSMKDENVPPELARKISNISVGSGVSNLSLSSLTSRSSKYLSPRHGTEESLNKDIEAMNEENKARTRVIHVRSKEFSDLMDKFRPGSTERDDTSSTSSKGNGAKLRRRAKERQKMDINRNENGVKKEHVNMDESIEVAAAHTQVPRTKCCCVV